MHHPNPNRGYASKALRAIGTTVVLCALGWSTPGWVHLVTRAAAAPSLELFSCNIEGKEDVAIGGSDVTELVTGEQTLQLDKKGNLTRLDLNLFITPASDASGTSATTASCSYSLSSGTYQDIDGLGKWSATLTAGSDNDATLCPLAGTLQGGISSVNSDKGLVFYFSMNDLNANGTCTLVRPRRVP